MIHGVQTGAKPTTDWQKSTASSSTCTKNSARQQLHSNSGELRAVRGAADPTPYSLYPIPYAVYNGRRRGRALKWYTHSWLFRPGQSTQQSL